MRILVTGGAGFIGSNLVEKLLSMEEITIVRVLDNLSTGFITNINPFMSNTKFEFINGDTTELKTCEEACKGIDIILHQAALGSVPRSMKEPLGSHNSNVNGFLHILESARKSGVKRVVYASSSAVYGNTKTVNDLDFCKPISFYGMTKHVNDLYAQIYTKYFGLNCIGLRYHNVFGKNQSFSGEYSAVIPIFVNLALTDKDLIIHGDGTQYRDFTHVSNVVHANLMCMKTENETAFGRSFDVGSNTNVSVNFLADTILSQCESESKKVYIDTRPGDIYGSCAHMQTAKELVDYDPVTSFKEGIVKTVLEYKSLLM